MPKILGSGQQIAYCSENLPGLPRTKDTINLIGFPTSLNLHIPNPTHPKTFFGTPHIRSSLKPHSQSSAMAARTLPRSHKESGTSRCAWLNLARSGSKPGIGAHQGIYSKPGTIVEVFCVNTTKWGKNPKHN